MNMKKIILTAVMAWTLLCVGPIDFSYAEDLAKDLSELTVAEMAEEKVPIILAQADTSTEDEKVEVEKEDEPDDDDEDDEDDEVEDVDDETVEVGVEGLERRRIRERR
jgi:hypothetical protein